MEQAGKPREQKRINKARILRYAAARGQVTRSEIAVDLHLSVPTTMQHVRELMAAGLLREEGEQASTGGRRAAALAIVPEAAYACGADITRSHLTMALVDARRSLVAWERARLPFANTTAYFADVERMLHVFLRKNGAASGGTRCGDAEMPAAETARQAAGGAPARPLVGIGFSLPGFVDRERSVLRRSDVLGCANVSFQALGERFGVPFSLENDASSAAYAEFHERRGNAVYLSLSGTVGGAFCDGGRLYEGDNAKSAEFGHMIIKKGGRRCYCGKRGCADAYCNAELLQRAGGGTLDGFFAALAAGEAGARRVWSAYRDDLALTVGNLRVLFDCEICLGGYVGGYLAPYLPELAARVKRYDRLDGARDYLRTGRHTLEASAYGAALPFIERFWAEV